MGSSEFWIQIESEFWAEKMKRSAENGEVWLLNGLGVDL